MPMTPLPSESALVAASAGYLTSDKWLAMQGSLRAQVALPLRAEPPSMSPSTLALAYTPFPLPASHPAVPSASHVVRSTGTGSAVCTCGNLIMPDSRFCPRCGMPRPVLPPQTLEGCLAPFGAQSVLLAPPAGVPEAIYEGTNAAAHVEARAVSQSLLERQLDAEATMDGIENSHKPRAVWNIPVDDEHFSSMPDWNRREWNHDPFYGWRTQEESKIPLLPAVKKALEAEKKAAIEARKNHVRLRSEGVNLTQDPFMAPDPQLSLFESLRPRRLDEPQHGPSDDGEWKKNHGVNIAALEAQQRLSHAVASKDPDELSAAIKDCRNAGALAPPRPADHAGPSWQNAQISEKILAAAHVRGNCLVQSEAAKQHAIIDYNIPVGIFVGNAPQQASGPQLESYGRPPRPPPAGEELDPARSWTSMYTPSPGATNQSEAARPAGSRASTAATDRFLYTQKPDPYDYYHTKAQPREGQSSSARPLNVGPSFQAPPGPLWFLGMSK